MTTNNLFPTYGYTPGLSKSDSPSSFFPETPDPMAPRPGSKRARGVKSSIALGRGLSPSMFPNRFDNRGASGGSGDNGEATRVQTSTRTVYGEDAPVAPELPAFQAPEWDEKAIRKKTQRNAAPGTRQLRNTVQQAMGRHYENPNVRRMTMRDVLSGYGMGLEGVMAGAAQQANQEYAQEYGTQYNEASVNYQADVNVMMDQYNKAWQKYLGSGESVTSQVRGPA